jgi:hypothetical protein
MIVSNSNNKTDLGPEAWATVGPKRTIRNGTRVLVRDLPEKCHGIHGATAA